MTHNCSWNLPTYGELNSIKDSFLARCFYCRCYITGQACNAYRVCGFLCLCGSDESVFFGGIFLYALFFGFSFGWRKHGWIRVEEIYNCQTVYGTYMDCWFGIIWLEINATIGTILKEWNVRTQELYWSEVIFCGARWGFLWFRKTACWTEYCLYR